jgi:hypothetical protein
MLKSKHYHLGIKHYVNQSTLSRTNENGDSRIFANFGTYLILRAPPLYADSSIPYLHFKNEVFSLDSTTISLSLNPYSW